MATGKRNQKLLRRQSWDLTGQSASTTSATPRLTFSPDVDC